MPDLATLWDELGAALDAADRFAHDSLCSPRRKAAEDAAIAAYRRWSDAHAATLTEPQPEPQEAPYDDPDPDEARDRLEDFHRSFPIDDDPRR